MSVTSLVFAHSNPHSHASIQTLRLFPDQRDFAVIQVASGETQLER